MIGSGKTFLLSLAIMFLHEVSCAAQERDGDKGASVSRRKWKVLVIASSDAKVGLKTYEKTPSASVYEFILFQNYY